MKTRLIVTAAAAALLTALPVAAFAETAPPVAAAQATTGVEVPPLGFQRRTLANGLDVYSLRDTSTSNVTVQVWYRVGSKDDPQDRSGFAHLFEHMMFKATRNLPSEAFDRLTEDIGGNNNASTYDDFTNYYESVPAQHLERMLFAESDRMGSLVVDPATLESETDVVKEELRLRILAAPYGRLFGFFMPQSIYVDHPYRRPGIGSIEELESASIEDVRRFHETFYRPDNAVLIVAGNFEQADLDRWVDGYFGGITNPATPIPVNNVREPEPTGPRDYTYYAPNVPLPAVVISYPAVSYGDPDRAALTVLDGILSTGESSRLYRSLVYDQEIAVQASSSPDFAQQAGNLSAYAILSGDHTAEQGIAAIRAEIARFRDEPVTQAELTEAKNELVANALRSRETVGDRAFQLGYALMMTNDPGTADREVAEIQAVTAADIQRVARRYLTDQRAITVRYLPADAEHPESIPNHNVPAPVTLDSLSNDYQVVELLPEGERRPLPTPGEPIAPATPQIAERTLPNGLRVLVAPTRGLPLVSARLNFDAGSADDSVARTGAAGFTAGMVTQGADGLTAPEIATQIEQLGASVGAGAGADFTNVYANAPANVFPQTVELMARIARNPTFDAEELRRQKDQALEGLQVALSSPPSIAGLTLPRVIYGDAPYGQPSGTATTIPAVTAEDLRAFHSRFWRPSNGTLVFSGDIEPEAAFALAERTFGDWRDPAGAGEPVANPAGQALAPRVVVIDQPGAGQAAVYAAMRSITRDNPDYYPLVLGNSLLGGGFSSRLNQEIRIKRGLSYGAGSGVGARQDVGTFTAQAQTRNNAVNEVVSLLLQEVGRMGTETPTEADVGPRRANLIGDFGQSLETVDGLGSWVANLALYDIPMSELAAYTGRIEAVTPAQIQAAFARNLPVSNASIVVVGDASQFIEQLRQTYPNVEVVPLSELNLDSATLL